MMRETKDSGLEWIGEIPAEWGVSKLERENKDDTDKYHALFYLSGGLHELIEKEY